GRPFYRPRPMDGGWTVRGKGERTGHRHRQAQVHLRPEAAGYGVREGASTPERGRGARLRGHPGGGGPAWGPRGSGRRFRGGGRAQRGGGPRRLGDDPRGVEAGPPGGGGGPVRALPEAPRGGQGPGGAVPTSRGLGGGGDGGRRHQ